MTLVPMATPRRRPPALIRKDATGAELTYLSIRRDFLDSLRDQHRALLNRKNMTAERRAEIIAELRNLASMTEDIKIAGLRMHTEVPLCRSVCESHIGYFNGGVDSAFAIGCDRNRGQILELVGDVLAEERRGARDEKVDGHLVWRG